eukprot:2979510-Prymnesium_polylepis.1
MAEEKAAADKEAALRPPRSKSATPAARSGKKDKNGGDDARGRGRQRMNVSGMRREGAVDALQRRSRSLMQKKDFRRSLIVNAVAPAGGATMSRCPERSDPAFEKGTRAGTLAHAQAVREWIKGNLSNVGSELRTVDQKDRNVMLFNDWLQQCGYEGFADWVDDSHGKKAVCRIDGEQQPVVPSPESLI